MKVVTMMEIKKTPRIMTVSEWFKEYTNFENIFALANLDPLFIKTEPVGYEFLFIFEHLVTMYGSRPVIPPMQFDSTKDNETIDKIKTLIQYRANMLNYKYVMLGKTMLDNFSDYLINYSTTRTNNNTKTYGQGSISHTGNDTVYQNQSITTTNKSTTDENLTFRNQDQREVKSAAPPAGESYTPENSVKTSYGHTINTTPSKETVSGGIKAEGYYNSGTKAKMLDQIRATLNFDLIDMWVKEILPTFTYSFYMTDREIPAEFLL